MPLSSSLARLQWFGLLARYYNGEGSSRDVLL
jgi:hypothetical protein